MLVLHQGDSDEVSSLRLRQDRSEPELFGYDVVAEPKILSTAEGLLRMTLTHHNHFGIVLDNPWVILSNKR